ncbi:MAG: M23 family metallopeptidase [Clostridia bacterium]|nr:M23 family metallopeptidase [Clostridia bacterium]
MNENEQRKNGAKNARLRQAAFYAVVLTLIAAAGLTAILMQRDARTGRVQTHESDMMLEVDAGEKGVAEDIAENLSEDSKGSGARGADASAAARDRGDEIRSARADSETDRDAVAASGSMKAGKFARPVSGGLLFGYSGDELVYSTTLDDWRVHGGADYKASPGEAVRAIADGTVQGVYNDDMWGFCVSVSHDGGLVSHYCGLAAEASVREGQRVSAGDTLGAAGTSAAAEAALEPHLHLEVTRNGARIDPEALFAP